jgi:hypothetical protein
MAFTSPYNFVPLNKDVYIPSWYNKVSHDIPFEDGEDGYIEVTWENVSPLFIRVKKEDIYSIHVVQPDGKRLYFIPGSSMKGMLRSALSILSFGKMIDYNNSCFGKQSVEGLVEKIQTKYAEKHDLCETIFGWTDKHSSMKGRVQICNAFAQKAIADNELLDEINGVLGQPKASYYPLYLQQDVAPYKTYDSIDAQISGRKRYRIHKGATTTSLPEGNGNENTTSSMRPIKPGQQFTMRINVHNLRKVEIGALLSAITFHRTPNVYHNIGAAKPFGYGKLKCIEIKLHGLKCEEDDYLRAFEKEMDSFSFSLKTGNGKWISSQPIKSLVAIALEHNDADVRMMELDEYKDYKSNNHFSRLHDVSNGLPSAFNRKDVFKKQHAGEYAQIEALCNNNEFEKAKPILEKLIERLELEHISADDENKLLSEIEEKIKAKEEQEAKIAEKLREQEIEDRLQRGFASVLNERYSAGPKFGQFKVMDWRTCLQKTERWLRDKNEDSLNAEEQDALAKTIERLKNSPTKNEKGSWGRFDSSIWRAISELLSEERAKQLFNNDQNARS